MTYLSEDTDLLLDLARSGDTDAAGRALARQRDRLCKMVRFRMDPRLAKRLDASDVVQEALIDAATRLDGYLEQPAVDFYPWLRSIAWNKLVDLHRKHVVAARRSVLREADTRLNDASAEQLAATLAAGDSEPWVRISRAELQRHVRDALESLSHESQEVLLLRFVEQLTSREAAQVIGISESALKGRQLRALQKLHSALDEGVDQ